VRLFYFTYICNMITREKILQVQNKIKAAIAEIEKEENVKIDFGTVSFNLQKYSTSMTVSSLEKSEKVESVLERTCRSIGFTQNVIGMSFDFRGDKYEITDIKTKNRKYPVIALETRTKKSYKFSVDTIKKILGGDKLINRNKNLDKLIDE
jgi:hypothetical protein